MAIFRSLKTLITKNRNEKIRTFLTAATTSLIPSPYAPLSLHPLDFPPPHRFLSPLSKWVAAAPPFRGPLFLPSPPWNLSQSSVPLHLRGGGILALRKVDALSLDLLRSRVSSGLLLVSGQEVDRFEEVEEDGDVRNGLVESFVNLPNLISIARLLSGPLLGWMIINERYSAAFLGLAISGATDWLDGYVARKMTINSVVGSYLDPLADKVLVASVALAMVQKGLLHSGLVGLVVIRDIVLVGGAVYHRASSLDWKWNSWYDFLNLDGTHREKVEPLFISKVNTVFQLVLVAGALLQPEFGTEETQLYIMYLSWLVALTTVASGAAYGVQHMKNSSALLTRKSYS